MIYRELSAENMEFLVATLIDRDVLGVEGKVAHRGDY